MILQAWPIVIKLFRLMKTENKTLVILSPGFAQSEADVNCLPLQQAVIKALKSNYPEMDIVILAFQYPYFKKQYYWFDNTVISFNGQNKGGFARLLLRQKIYRALTELNSDSNICGIISFWLGECALTGKRFADKNGIKHFCWILGQDARETNRYVRRTKAAAGELIALSDFIQQEFKKNHGLLPQHIIPAGVDPAQFSSSVKEKDIDIVATGSLIPLKQFEVWISVIAAVQKEIPEVKAMLIGDGPEKNKLQRLIAAHGLEDNIMLTGELPHQIVLQQMQRAKVFLHTSSYEGFGVVCLEALQAGCNVISFYKPMQQPIEHWYIAAGEDEMVQTTLQLLQDPHLPNNPVTFLKVDEIAKRIMQLFDAG